jgi:hypothetical protein
VDVSHESFGYAVKLKGTLDALACDKK